MKKTYRVADHNFSVDLPDDSPLWERMGQYAPFQVDGCPEALFSLTLTDDVPVDGLSMVYDGCQEKEMPRVRLFRRGGDWLFEMAPLADAPTSANMLMDSAFSKAELCIERPQDALFSINNALMLAFAFATAPLMTLEMHASVVRHDGKGYLFLGKSGTGKSTHSRQWLENMSQL